MGCGALPCIAAGGLTSCAKCRYTRCVGFSAGVGPRNSPAMSLPPKHQVFEQNATGETRVRWFPALLMAVRKFASENGYSFNRAVMVLVYDALERMEKPA